MTKNYYEMTYILNPVMEEENFKAAVDKVTKLVESHGGEIDEVDEWGLRQFAYEIDKKRSGYYVNMYFSGEPDLIGKIERPLRIDDDILRYMTLKYDAKMLRHRELQRKGELIDIFAVSEDDEDDSNDDD